MSRLRAALVALLVTLTSLVALTSAPSPAYADECYTWNRTLSSGASGSDVAELQVRVAGWAGYGVVMSIDGSYGSQTATAVRNFQSAYGLSADGVAGPQTYAKIYELQDADCSPAHFSWAEVDGGCGQGGYSGGSVSAATVQQNLLRAMWRAEALRHRMGDKPLVVTSGFRSKSCDASVGGSGSGQHTYGTALDLVGVSGSPTLCSIAQNARYAGFGGIFGPGYPNHDDHVHVDVRSSISWSAPTCGI
ncbi:D-Ala-D-Ala carboxypeptidase family metallohydrolase [Nocardioides sp. GCM10027113]|uniref:D-Ala-D-Ala carboxypeptidase family metallohydrolase n=1 Tax=unclassified Nocardioides TaxID=2615069 RepID=UPI0036086E54